MQSYKKTLKEVEELIIENPNYTLALLYSYVEKFQGLFNTLNRIIIVIKERRLTGCQILSLIHQYILNGNKMVHEAIVQYVFFLIIIKIIIKYFHIHKITTVTAYK